MKSIAHEQFLGAVLGLAVADALGAKWEGITADLIYEMGPAEEIVAHPSGETLYYTDDTQMMIGVAQTLIEFGGIDKHALAEKFAQNYHPDRGYGQGARRIINAIGRGEDWEELASSIFNGEGSLGNGAAMRVSPVGIFFAPNLDDVTRQAAASATPTHCHEIGIDGARILAAATAIAAMSAGGPCGRRDFLERLRPVARTEEFQWQIDHALKLKPHDSLSTFGSSLEAHRSVTTSILCFLASPDSYTETVSRAIAQGDDVDTLAAMAGTLSGSRLGVSAIPERLIDCLEDNEQGRAYLIDLANTLWEKRQEGSNRPAP